MQKVLIIGATSAIAEATARLYASRGAKLFLVARNQVRLKDIASDLLVRGANEVSQATLDTNDIASHASVIEEAWSALGDVDVVLVAHGTLPKQQACEQDVHVALQEFATNATSTIALLTLLANRMQAASNGTIAVISSVAGDRGRASNYLYGAAKAAVSTFLSGLRQRLGKSGVNVLTIKPGFVDTPMSILPDGSHEYDSDWFRDIYVKHGRIPLRRAGTPADMAGPAFFLCSDDSQYVTGQILSVDGGASATF
jgi:NAD(P)-dependent dehydrogenase (short-subunit alcohol dehydrogenase family)